MHCPFCNADDTKVIDSRLVADGAQVRRRRECQACNERFTTYETAELVMPRIVKRDGTRVPFNEEKLRGSIGLALQKRPIRAGQVEAALTHIDAKVRATGERELPSSAIGEAVMEELRKLDSVAFVRFAPVYRNFTDISEFREEVDRLEKGR